MWISVWKEVLWRLMLFFVVVCWEGWIFKHIVGHPTIPGVTRSSWNFQTSHWTTLPESNSKSTCKWWLEDDRFLLGWVDEQPIFRCELLLCSGRVSMWTWVPNYLSVPRLAAALEIEMIVHIPTQFSLHFSIWQCRIHHTLAVKFPVETFIV